MLRRCALRTEDTRKTSAEQGFALVAVVMTIAILTLFLLTALAYTLNSMNPARRSQDAKAAEQAALAGVDEYLSRLNTNDNYWKNENKDKDNAAFSVGQPIQGTGGDASTAASYTYEVLSEPDETTKTGVIRLRVTGTSGAPTGAGEVERMVTVELKRSGLLDYVYLTDYEVSDPDLVSQDSRCNRHYYATSDTPARPGNKVCLEIQWGGNDTVNGPLHSNDALQINGPTRFTSKKTETAWPAAAGLGPDQKTWWGTQAAPLSPNRPTFATSVSLPESNNDLLRSVAPDVDGDGDVGPGCYYTGNTRIILQGSTMRVLSPSTTGSDIPRRCYDTSEPGKEQTLTIPPSIYVYSTTNPCTIGAVGYPAPNERYTTGPGNASAWSTGVGASVTTNYACSRGTVFVEGTANTQVTISGSDDVVVVGDLRPDTTTENNVIGLIAGNCVWIYHPLKSGTNGSNLNSASDVNTVQAAILALRHSFVVQNWGNGSPLGTLNVYGAIAQKFRGPVGTGTANAISTGYSKNYVYDERLTYTQPPFFLNAANAPFKVLRMTDG